MPTRIGQGKHGGRRDNFPHFISVKLLGKKLRAGKAGAWSDFLSKFPLHPRNLRGRQNPEGISDVSTWTSRFNLPSPQGILRFFPMDSSPISLGLKVRKRQPWRIFPAEKLDLEWVILALGKEDWSEGWDFRVVQCRQRICQSSSQNSWKEVKKEHLDVPPTFGIQHCEYILTQTSSKVAFEHGKIRVLLSVGLGKYLGQVLKLKRHRSLLEDSWVWEHCRN